MSERGGSQARSSGKRGVSFPLLVIALLVAIFAWKMLHIAAGVLQTGGGNDFYNFWDAGDNFLRGDPARVYTGHSSAFGDLLPLAYPPPFLLLMAPFALLPSRIGALLWLIIGVLAYLIAVRRSVAGPPAKDTSSRGSGKAALLWLLAGAALLATLALKPHLSTLVPARLVTSGTWTALAYGAAIGLCLAVTGVAYFICARRPWLLAIANPAAAYNLLFGQTGFFTAAILLTGLSLVDASPAWGGALLGSMVLKPQLALLIPVALVASGRWRALAAAAASAALLFATAALFVGLGTYIAWWTSLHQFGHWLAGGFWNWSLLASPYALLRWLGAPYGLALGLQLAITIGAAWMVAESWRSGWTSKIAVLAAATMLASPYLFTYDAVLLVAPLALFARRARVRLLVVWGLTLVPLLGTIIFAHIMPLSASALPNCVPVAAALSLFFLWNERRRDSADVAGLARA